MMHSHMRRRRKLRHGDPLQVLASKLNGIEGLDKALSMLLKLSLVYGGIWIFQYCYFGISFTPVDLSIGDGVYWIFVAAALSLMTLLLAGCGLMLLLPLMGFSEEKHAVRASRAALRKRGMRYRWRRRTMKWLRKHLWGGVQLRPWGKFVVALGLIDSVLCVLLVVHPAWFGGAGPSKSASLQYLGLGWASFSLAAFWLHRFGRMLSWSDAIAFTLASSVSYGIAVMAVGYGQWALLSSMLIGGVFLGVFLVVMTSQKKGGPEHQLALWVIGLMIFLAPLFASQIQPAGEVNFLTRTVFQRLGLSAYGSNAILSGDAAKAVAELIDREQLAVIHCDMDGGNLLLSGIDIPWQGLGKKTLLSFPGKRKPDETDTEGKAGLPIRIPVPADQVTSVTSGDTRCASLPTKVYFQFASAEPSDQEMVAKLKQDVAEALELSGPQWCLSKVVVTARSDQRPMRGNKNDQLAKDRSARVLKDAGLLGHQLCRGSSPETDIELVGSREPIKANCGLRGDAQALAECEAANRVVNVRLGMALVKSNAKPHQ